MASSSYGKNVEKQQQPKPTSKAPQHMSLSKPAVERLKEIQNLAEKYYFINDEEKIRRVNEFQANMDINDLLSYVMYGDGEEVVWNDVVWNVQSITEVLEYREAKRLKKETNVDLADPPLPATEKHIDEAASEKPPNNGNI